MCWPFVATGLPEVNIIGGTCGYSIAKTKPKSFFNAIIEAPVSILVEVNSVSVEVFLPNSLERNLLIFCFLRSYALRLKPLGFLRQKTDPTITVETWYFSNSTDTSRFILTRIRVGEESFKTAYLQENHIRTFSPHHFQVIVVSLSNCSAAYPVKMDIMFSGGHTSTITTHPAPQPLNETVPEYKCLHFVTRFK